MYQEINNPDKVLIAREILQVMDLLGIPPEKFSELKQQHGGLIQLHIWCEKTICGE